MAEFVGAAVVEFFGFEFGEFFDVGGGGVFGFPVVGGDLRDGEEDEVVVGREGERRLNFFRDQEQFLIPFCGF